jgi:protein-tyrosine phosphatase
MPVHRINANPARLGIMARPRGHDWLLDELRALKQSGVDVVVSALTATEADDLGLSAEADGCVENGLLFLPFPIEDRAVPAHSVQFELFINQLLERARNGKSVVIHCRAGIGRSSLIAACVLIRMGSSPSQAFQLIEHARGCPVPETPEQHKWVENYSARSVDSLA